MRYIKTYGINGLLEWHGYVHSNGVKMRVDFTNGSVTAYGVAPATFRTKHELTQHIIESSEEFKWGRIRLVSKSELPEEANAIDSRKQIADNAQPKKETKTEEVKVKEEEVVKNDGVQKVKVGSKTEAIEWLKDKYPDKGYNGFTLKGNAAFEAACKENNVEFDIQG